MSGVCGYEDACGNREILECPYSVCDGCPLNPDEREEQRDITDGAEVVM